MSREKRTRSYVDRRTKEGKTKKEIIRCLKRYIAREVYRILAPYPYTAPNFGTLTNIEASLDRTRTSLLTPFLRKVADGKRVKIPPLSHNRRALGTIYATECRDLSSF